MIQSKEQKQVEILRTHLLSLSDSMEGLLRILLKSRFYNRGLHWALEKKWLLLGWLFSRLVDFHRSRFFHALNELKEYPSPPQSSGPESLDLEHAYADYQQALTEKIDRVILPLRRTSISDGLAEIIVSKYSALFRRPGKTLGGAPGSFLRRAAEFMFSPRVYSEVFEPTLRDLFDEYCEALDKRRTWKARWVRITYYWSFWSAVLAQLPISAVKIVYKIWKATR